MNNNNTQKQCFDGACRADAHVPRDPSCFTGPLHCQHGGAECAVNAIAACTLNLTAFKWKQYLPFVVCMFNEEEYGSIAAAENYTVINETAKSCLHTADFSGEEAEEVLQFFYTKKDHWLEEMAKRTILHDSFPYVRIKNKTGDWYRMQTPDNEDDDVFVKAVCDLWVDNGGHLPTASEVKTEVKTEVV